MKKIAITFCLLGLIGTASSAFAGFVDKDSSKAPFIDSRGYSTEMARMVDLVKYNHTGGASDVYYDLDPYSNCNNDACIWYTAAKRWLDPIQDDKLFGRHEIVFTNGWFEFNPPFVGKDKVKYKAPIGKTEVKTEKVENL